MDATKHGTEDQIERYILRALPEEELAAFEEHLLICDLCRQRTEKTVAYTSAMREAFREEQDRKAARARRPLAALAGRFSWLRSPGFPMALGLALIVGALAMYFWGDRSGLPDIAVLQLAASRGDQPSVKPARQLELTLAGAPADGGPFRVEVVNGRGQTVWGGLADSEGDAVLVKVPVRIGPGDYFVRLYSADGPVLREYGFRVGN